MRTNAVSMGLLFAACFGIGMGGSVFAGRVFAGKISGVTAVEGAAEAAGVSAQPTVRAVTTEHGVLTLSSGDAKFLMSTFSAQSWQEIVRGLGLQPVREFNAMSLVDLMVAAGWEIVGYEVVVVPLANERSQTTERYLMRRLVQ